MWRAGLVSLGVMMAAINVLAEEPRLSFNRDIRPILSDTCFQCHGPDDQQRKAGLRLDRRSEAISAAESGATAIVPNDHAASELWKRITSTDTDLVMPPPSLGKKLTARQLETLKAWIDQGAPYEGHWAFQPIVRPAVPDVQETRLIRTPIDRFILARLEQDGMKLAAEADKSTLLRRVTLDLTGLPPTAAEHAAFLADTTPEAYEQVVDRLLASPRYGEHMALAWLDMARYADSNGFQVDSSRYQWPWRNWVINAYNRNLPFDRFTIEQLAGDLLPEPTTDQLVATGFQRNHRLNGEGGIIAEEWRVETVIDRVETTGLTWLGLTLNCCRCHDHKYDPITQREFYQLFAFFNNIAESGTLQGESKNTDPILAVPSPEQQAQLDELAAAQQTAEQHAAEARKQLPELVAAWEPKFAAQLSSEKAVWQRIEPQTVRSLGGATLTQQEDGTYLASGKNPPNDTYEVVAPLAAGDFSGVLLECFPDPSLPEQSLGRYSNGNFVLSGVEAEITAPSLKSPLVARFIKAEADYSQKGWEIGFITKPAAGKGWAVDGPTKKEPRTALFLVERPLTVPAEAQITVRLKHAALNQHNIGRFRLSTTSQPPAAVSLKGLDYPAPLRAAFATPREQRKPQQQKVIDDYFRTQVDNPVRTAEAAVTQAKQAVDAYRKQLPSVMVMREGQPRQAKILLRGQYDRPGDPVSAGLPAFLPAMPDGAPLNRLGLAQWIVSPQQPLTARVWVNRTWERLFGTGIVKTSENFGSQAEFPSHPALLDWLAAEFMQPTATPQLSGVPAQPWDMKAFQKLIVMSAVYRQSSRVDRTSAERDPENRLLARGPRFRLSGEVIRDSALFSSGLLVEKLGGPSVRPYMPEGVWDETSRYGDLRNYRADDGPGLYRRSLYTIWKRTAAPPSMLLFDAPSREICTVKRSRTNTPLQALSLMNEITYVEAARKLGERMLTQGGQTDAERIASGFQWVLARPAKPAEVAVLVAGLNEDRTLFEQRPDDAKQFLAVGAAPVPLNLNQAELAAYALTANVLLNLDEALTRE